MVATKGGRRTAGRKGESVEKQVSGPAPPAAEAPAPLPNLWREFRVEIAFEDRLMAGLPKDPKSILTLMELKDHPELAEEVMQEVGAEAPAPGETATRLVFKRNEEGLYLEGYTWRAHLKDCAQQLAALAKAGKLLGDKTALAALRAKCANKIYVRERHIPLRRDGGPILEPDDEYVHPVSVVTAQGPRSAVKVNEYVERAECSFTLEVLNDGVITPELLTQLFSYGRLHGYGPERGIGHGRYQFTVTPVPPPA